MEFKVSSSDFVFEQRGKLHDTYKVGRKIGEGSFSTVRAMRHIETWEPRAVKTIHKKALSKKEAKELMNEVSILGTLDHPNIIKLYEYYQDEKSFYLITELCEGGELFEKIIENSHFSESKAAHYFRQILSVLAYLHQRGLVHRDFKPENFLLNSNSSDASLKIVDFGSAAHFDPDEPLQRKVGSAYYIAPEVLERNYNFQCDLWSAGVCLYILLCGYPPFGGRTDQETLSKIRTGRYKFSSPEWDNISFEAKDLVSKLLKKNPEERIQAKQALQHPWLAHASKLPIDSQNAAKYFDNLKGFKSEQMLQKAAWAFIGNQLASHEERQEMMTLFQSLDTDDSGTLDKEELKIGFSKVFGEDFTEEDVEKIMKEVDIDGSGEIDYSEFITATLNKQKLLSSENLLAAFRTFDVDNSGAISIEELKNILGKSNRYDEQIWQNLVREVDTNGDGEIDFEEFCSMMTSVTNTDIN